MFTRQILFRLRWVLTEEGFLPQRLMNDAFQESELKYLFRLKLFT